MKNDIEGKQWIGLRQWIQMVLRAKAWWVFRFYPWKSLIKCNHITFIVIFTPVNEKVNRKRFQGTYGELNFTCFVKKVCSTKPVRLMRYQCMACESWSTILFYNLWEKGNYLLSSSTKVTVPNWVEFLTFFV